MGQLGWRDRAQLLVKAVTGTLPEPGTVGGKLLAGVINAGGQPPVRGVRQQLEAYGTTPWLRAVVSRISFDVASTAWCLYIKKKGREPAVRDQRVRYLQRTGQEIRQKLIREDVQSGNLTKVETHPMLDLLDGFNSFHTGLSGRRVTMQHIDLAGEAFWLLERGRLNQPVAIWPIPPSWILSTPTMLFPFYRVNFRGWHGNIPATEFVWFNELDPANPYSRGRGTGQSLADELETDEYAAKHVKAFYFNRGRPDLIVSPKEDGTIDESEVRRLEEGWSRQSTGFWRAFKPFFLRRAVDVKDIDQNFRAQQLIQLREFERNTCIQVFGVSPEIFGIIASNANRATITVAEYIYGRRVLVPRLEMLRTVMQERVVPEFDDRLILEYENPVAQDQQMEMEAAKAAPWAYSIDEWRGFGGRPPHANPEFGRLHMLPTLVEPATPEDMVDLPLRNEPSGGPGSPPSPVPPKDETEEAAWMTNGWR